MDISIFGIGLHALVALGLAIHALRTGRPFFWLFVLFFFPLLGSIVYFFVELLPELQGSLGARRAGAAVRRMVDPGHELREAREAWDITPSIANRTRLAAALLQVGEAAEAVEHYRACLEQDGHHDPDLMLGLARAEFAAGDVATARETLESLTAHNPEYRSQDGHLLYARVLAALGEGERARAEFDTLVGYFSGPEARCHYGEWLAQVGDQDAARTQFQAVIDAARRWPAHTRRMHAEWLTRARRGLAATG